MTEEKSAEIVADRCPGMRLGCTKSFITGRRILFCVFPAMRNISESAHDFWKKKSDSLKRWDVPCLNNRVHLFEAVYSLSI